MNGDAGCGGDDALDSEQHDGGCHRVDSEQPKNQSAKIRINRSDPRGRAGVLGKGRTETLSSNDMLGDAANFQAERKDRARGADVSFFQENKTEAQDEAGNEKQDVQFAIGSFLGRRVRLRGRFRGKEGHVRYCERRSATPARWSSRGAFLLGTRKPRK